MKKIVISLLTVSLITQASAASCVDLKSGLSRGMENSNVLVLQNFLYENGYLKAKPNGYYGVGTFAGVKAYQKSLGFEQAGSVGPATRAAIKKATCSSSQSSQTTTSNQNITTPSVTKTTDFVYKPTVAIVKTPSGLRNAKRREDLEMLLRALYRRFVESRGVHPVAITDTPVELCVKPPYQMPTATATEVAVLTTPDSPCKNYVDIAYLSPSFMRVIPRDPSLATSSVLLGYTIMRDDTNQITLAAKNPEDKAIIKVTCNFNGYCNDIRQVSTISYGLPVFSSSSQSIILRDATPKTALTLYGKNFSATNTVVLISKYTGKSYPLGEFSSTDSTSLPLKTTSISQSFSCGRECTEKIPLGDYSFTITNDSGKSNPGYLTLQGITTSSFSARANSTVTPNTKNVRIGSIAISAGVPVILKSLTVSATSTSTTLSSKITTFVLKDSAAGTTFSGPGFTLGDATLYENQSKVYDLYVDVADVQPDQSGFITYGGKLVLVDLLTKTEMELPIKDISFSVSY